MRPTAQSKFRPAKADLWLTIAGWIWLAYAVGLLATDSAERFARVGGTFLGRPLAAGDVEVVDL